MTTIYNRMPGVFAAVFAGLLVSCASLKTPKRVDLVSPQAPMKIGKYPVRFNRTSTGEAAKGHGNPNVGVVLF